MYAIDELAALRAQHRRLDTRESVAAEERKILRQVLALIEADPAATLSTLAIAMGWKRRAKQDAGQASA
jgi:hypothetical protein